MPLVRSFWLATKQAKKAWIEPVVDKQAKTVQFEVKTGEGVPAKGTKLRGKSQCLFCGINNITDAVLRGQAQQYGMGRQLIAIVAEGSRGRIYMSPPPIGEDALEELYTEWLEQPLSDNARWFSPPGYGLKTYRDLFTPRQLVALTTFSDLVSEARELVSADAAVAGLPKNGVPLHKGGAGASAYADAIETYLAFGINHLARYSCVLAPWNTTNQNVVSSFWSASFANGLGFCRV